MYKGFGNEKTNNGTHVEVSLEYTNGGMNYFTGNGHKRGYRVAVHPSTISGEGMYRTRQFTLGSGYFHHLLDTKRLSRVTLKKLFDATKKHFEALANAFAAGDEQKQLELVKLIEELALKA